jgi:hypothetical protein
MGGVRGIGFDGAAYFWAMITVFRSFSARALKSFSSFPSFSPALNPWIETVDGKCLRPID